MKKEFLILIAAVLIMSCTNQEKADFIYTNGKVYTVDESNPWAEAVAVKGDKILFVGEADDAKKFKGEETTVINLQGKVMLPGFVSSHEHPGLLMGFASGCKLEFTGDKDKMLKVVREYVANNPDGPDFSFGGAFEGTVDITTKDLDAIVSDRPFFMIAASVHGGWCNTKALEAVNAEEADKSEHYDFGKFPDGSLNGYIATSKTVVFMMDELDIMKEEALTKAAPGVLGNLSIHGITSVFDAGAPPFEESFFKAISGLEKAGKLNVRLQASVITQGNHMTGAAFEKGEKFIPMYSSEMFDVNTFKIHGDGSVEGWSAGLLAPYSDKPESLGMTSLSKEEFDAAVMRASKNGWDIHFHTIGDRTNRYALDAFEKAREAGYTENRFATGHTTMVDPDDIQRYIELDITANVFATLVSIPSKDILDRVGEERYMRNQPNGILDKAGVRVAMSADWPVADINPWLQMAVCMERRMPGTTESHGPKEAKMTAEEIVKTYTINGAYMMGWEELVGSIEIGKKADLIVIDTDIFSASAEEIAKTKVVTTMLGGKFVYHPLDGVVPEGIVETTGFKPGYIFI